MTDTEPVTRLGAAFLAEAPGALTAENIASFRAVPPLEALHDKLGLLHDLPGFWSGSGFNLIARPDFQGANKIFLELSMTHETIEFSTIGSPVANRGSLQDDIDIFGVTYLQRVMDAGTGGALHIEPGMWINIPPTTAPKADGSIARLATIPHGNAMSAVGTAQAVASGLNIPPANTVPFKIGTAEPKPGTPNPLPEYDLSTENRFRTNPLPPEITQALVDNPNVLLTAALVGQTVKNFVLLTVDTKDAGGIENIPFLVKNADAARLSSVFAIEHVENSGELFLQLQYSQTVLLDFDGMSYPHVSVGTLIKAF
jgi:hypothetical protein